MPAPSSSEKRTVPYSGTDHGAEHEHGLREVNETGHVQELERDFSLFSICSVGIVTGYYMGGYGYFYPGVNNNS